MVRHTSLAAALSLALVSAPLNAVTRQVSVQDNSFTPFELRVRAGDSVQWTNTGGFHNVLADDLSFRCANGCDDTGGSGAPAPGPWSFTRSFAAPGTYPYHCEVHGVSMSGRIVVAEAAGAIPPDEVVMTLAAADFSVELGPIEEEPFLMQQSRGLSNGVQLGLLRAGLMLPAGSLLTRAEVEACGLGVGPAVTVRLHVCQFGAPSCVADDLVSKSFDPGGEQCGVFQAPITGIEIDNLHNTYIVQIRLNTTGNDIAFRSVRVYYKRQVAPAPAEATFDDVALGSAYFQYVEALSALGVTTGCGGDNFCPDNPVTRGQLALILAKLLGLNPN